MAGKRQTRSQDEDAPKRTCSAKNEKAGCLQASVSTVQHAIETTTIAATTSAATSLPAAPTLTTGLTVLTISTVLALLECPVCLATRVTGRIFACLGGHYCCGECRQQVPHCPTCRSTPIQARQVLLEKVRDAALFGTTQACSYASTGCTFLGKHQDLCLHEGVCTFRLVSCPAAHRAGGCDWRRPLRQLAQHLHENGCANILKFVPSTRVPTSESAATIFYGHVMTGAETAAALLSNGNTFHWCPVYLQSAAVLPLAPYLLIARDYERRRFIFSLRSALDQAWRRYFCVEIVITGGHIGQGTYYRYSSLVDLDDYSPFTISSTATQTSALVVPDSQITKLSDAHCLCSYSVSIFRRPDAPPGLPPLPIFSPATEGVGRVGCQSGEPEDEGGWEGALALPSPAGECVSNVDSPSCKSRAAHV